MLTEARLSVTFSTAEDILMAEDTKKDSFFFFLVFGFLLGMMRCDSGSLEAAFLW